MTSLLTVPLSTFVRVAWRGLMGEAPFGNREDFFQYFQNRWQLSNPHVECLFPAWKAPAPPTILKDGTPN